jgi:hypothetical protein
MTREEIEGLPEHDFRSLLNTCLSVAARRRTPNSISRRLAALAVGENILLPGRSSYLNHQERVMARELLGGSGRWSVRRLNTGLRVTRIA